MAKAYLEFEYSDIFQNTYHQSIPYNIEEARARPPFRLEWHPRGNRCYIGGSPATEAEYERVSHLLNKSDPVDAGGYDRG